MTPFDTASGRRRLVRSLLALVVVIVIVGTSRLLRLSGSSLKLADLGSLVFLVWLTWFWIRFFPSLWQNRRDDKFAVVFGAAIIVSLVVGIWKVTTGL